MSPIGLSLHTNFLVRFSTPTHIYICTIIYMFYSTKVIPTLLQTQILAANFHWDVVLWYSIGAHSENILAPDHLLGNDERYKVTKVQTAGRCTVWYESKTSSHFENPTRVKEERADLQSYSKKLDIF